ncbi:MAG TPA: PDZ domain-containing protein, partial [Bacteroidota bacterium]|nr:PDZ domain-containing protein [Bacteroidota bacterium]
MNIKVTAAALLLALAAGGTSRAQEPGGNAGKTPGRGWLGVAIQDVTPRVAREKNLHVKSGALVNGVTDESPAEDAGIKEHDVIVAFNGKTIDESDDLLEAVRAAAPGEKADITVFRGEEKKVVHATLGKAPKRDTGFAFRYPGPMTRFRFFRSEGIEGLSLSDLNRQLGAYFGAPGGRGVLVEEVERESPGEQAGFKAGDVIIRAGSEDVETTEDIAEALEGHARGEKVEIGVLRKGEKVTLTAVAEGP